MREMGGVLAAGSGELGGLGFHFEATRKSLRVCISGEPL